MVMACTMMMQYVRRNLMYFTPDFLSSETICDPSGRNQSHVGRVRFPLRAEMHGMAHITDSCFIAIITSKIC